MPPARRWVPPRRRRRRRTASGGGAAAARWCTAVGEGEDVVAGVDGDCCGESPRRRRRRRTKGNAAAAADAGRAGTPSPATRSTGS